jgi:hypothetical protein
VNIQSTLVLSVLVLGSTLLRAQSAGGSLRGVVEDPSGARLRSAKINIGLPTHASYRSIAADDRGEFRVDNLPPGDYQVSVTCPGFSDVAATVSIAVSTVRDTTVVMRPPVVRESVKVESSASSITTQHIDAASQVHQAVITRQDLETLPLAQRSFANIAYLAPGTEPVEPSDPTKARITAVSTGGSSGLNNELSVDDMDNSDDYIGGFLQNFPPESIQEFSMRTAQEDADTGGTTAGSVVVVTRRGGNEWHGEAAVYERAATLNARYAIENPAPDPKQRYSRQDYVGTLGGPLKSDRLWTFGAFQASHEDASIAYSPANIEQFDALAELAAQGLIPGVNSIAVPSSVPVPFRDYSGSVRLDWAQSAKSSWYVRGSNDSYSTHNNLVQQATLPSTGLFTRNAYWNVVVANAFLFGPGSMANFSLGASGLRLTQTRNSDLGFALAFPFSSTALTISGFETFGDNQFATPITFFPSRRYQEKYQARYDLMKETGHHALKFGVNFIHEPVLSGAFPDNTETLYEFPQNPTFYQANPSDLAADMAAGESTSNLGGGFAQNLQRLAFYAQDSWRAVRNLTLNYGLRYTTTFGLFHASGRTQADNPTVITLNALQIPLVNGSPADDRKQVGPRLGFAYSLHGNGNNVIRAGWGIYFNDLAQNGWAAAFQAVYAPPGSCVDPVQNPGSPQNAGCVPGHNFGGSGSVISPDYRTPYALHITAGFQHAFNADSLLSVDYTHEQGNHGYRAYSYMGGANLFTPLLSVSDVQQGDVVPDINDFHSDNRSSYDALMLHLQQNISGRLNLVANYTLSQARTWGCVLGELFDYVNGVCDPLHPFAPGDYGPSGEDVRHRFVLAGIWHAPGGIDLSTLTQAESARPFTITTADGSGRISMNGQPTSLDQFRGAPFVQVDLRVARPIHAGERWSFVAFVELFNLFNRVNPGNNFVTDIASCRFHPTRPSRETSPTFVRMPIARRRNRLPARMNCAFPPALSEISSAPALLLERRSLPSLVCALTFEDRGSRPSGLVWLRIQVSRF